MNESIPSSAQPPQAARNPRIWSPVSRSTRRGPPLTGSLEVVPEEVILRTPLYQVNAQDGPIFIKGKPQRAILSNSSLSEIRPIYKRNSGNLHVFARKLLEPQTPPSNCSTWNNPMVKTASFAQGTFPPGPNSVQTPIGLARSP